MRRLTDEQCDEFRRLPCSFNDMVREIYRAGYLACLDDAMSICKDVMNDEGDQASLVYLRMRSLKDGDG